MKVSEYMQLQFPLPDTIQLQRPGSFIVVDVEKPKIPHTFCVSKALKSRSEALDILTLYHTMLGNTAPVTPMGQDGAFEYIVGETARVVTIVNV
jgi:hypothetical protein